MDGRPNVEINCVFKFLHSRVDKAPQSNKERRTGIDAGGGR